MSVLAWDVETHRMKAGMMAPKLVCVSTAEMKNGREVTKLYDRRDGLRVIKDAIRARRPLVAHNQCYDAGIIAAEDPDFLPEIFDALDRGDLRCTKIREMIIQNYHGELKFEYDPDSGEYKKQDFTLKRLVLRRLHKNIYGSKKSKDNPDVWQLNYHKLEGVPIADYPEDAAKYAVEDSIYGLRIHDDQTVKDLRRWDACEGGDRAPGEQHVTRTQWALNLMGTWGVRTDGPAVRAYKKELERDFAKSIEKCQEWDFRRGGADTSRDTKKIKAAVEDWYAERGLPLKLTEGGDICCDREVLTGTDHPGLLAVSQSIRIEKNLKTYIPALERGVLVPICPSYNPMVETFRTSCSGGMKIDKVPVGFNAQNVPRNGPVRSCVVPRPGSIFAFCDLDTIEMGTLAEVQIELFGHSAIAEAIKAGKDCHVDFAAEQLGMPYRQAFDRYKSGDKEIENARQSCKISNYGCMGGMGWKALMEYAKQYGITFSPRDAKRLREGFRKKWGMEPYFNFINKMVSGGSTTIEFPLTGLFRGDVGYTQLANSLFQHPTAIFATAAVYRVSKECYVDKGSPLYGCRPWLFNHDEIGIEIPYDEFGPERTHAAAMRLKEIMEEEANKILRRVGGKASVCLTPRWIKGAKPLMENGILVPVVPKKIVENGKEKTVWEPWEGRWMPRQARKAA